MVLAAHQSKKMVCLMTVMLGTILKLGTLVTARVAFGNRLVIWESCSSHTRGKSYRTAHPSIALLKVSANAGTSAGNSQVWSPSRKELEMAIQAEKAKDHQDWNPDLQSEEQRLTKRLGKLNLEMKVMIGDGNCQVDYSIIKGET